MNKGFRFTVGSEPDFDDLVGDLYFDDKIVCVVTQEEGFDSMKLHIYGPPDGGAWMFSLREFEEWVAALKKRMWELRRSSPKNDGPQDET